jgi:hypothetical protein
MVLALNNSARLTAFNRYFTPLRMKLRTFAAEFGACFPIAIASK